MKNVKLNLAAVLLFATIGATSSFAAIKHVKSSEPCSTGPNMPANTTYNPAECPGGGTICCFLPGTDVPVLRP